MLNPQLGKIEIVEIQIVKAIESSNNRQYFVRARRVDSTEILGTLLEYQCFQTLCQDRKIKECIENALFSASFLLRFFGHTGKDIKFINFDNKELEYAQNAKRFWRIAD